MSNVLRGQNLRVLSYNDSTDKIQVFALATSCVITTTNNTESNKTKDDIGLADKPEVVSRAGTIQVDTLNVLDAGAMLTAIHTFQKFVLMWDEVSTTDNQTTAQTSAIGKVCADCLCNDLSLTFNDREISAKSVQFIMNSAPTGLAGAHYNQTVIGDTAKTRGQFVRLLLGADGTTAPTKVIAWARQLTLHVSVQLESIHTKDDADNLWDSQEAVGLTYDISTTALVKGNSDNITSQVDGQELADIETIQASAIPVKWRIANMSGANQRTMGAVIVSGLVQVTQIQRNAAVGNVAEYTTQFNGYGDYTVGS